METQAITNVTAVSPVSSLKEIREGESRCSGLDQEEKKDFGLLGELKFCSC